MANRIDRAIAGVELLARRIRALPAQPQPGGPGAAGSGQLGDAIEKLFAEQRRIRTMIDSTPIHIEDVFPI